MFCDHQYLFVSLELTKTSACLFQLLNEIEKKRRFSLDLAQELLAASFGRPLPNPGKVVHIRALVSELKHMF